MMSIMLVTNNYFSTFKQNRCPDGIVNIGYIPFILSGKNVFISNRGPALRVSSNVNDTITMAC